MTKVVYVLIAVAVLIALLAIFIISFVLYKRTPVPAGCENIKINEENCSNCQNKECSFYKSEENK